MEFLKMVDKPEAVVIDNDGTLHKHAEYLELGRQAEMSFIASRIGCEAVDEAEKVITARRLELGCDGQKATMTEVVSSFGITQTEWNTVRETCYHPERFLQFDERMVQAVEALTGRYRVAIASNNPRKITQRALWQLGFGRLFDRLRIIGPEDVGINKADPQYFQRVAALLGVDVGKCINVGDRREADGDSAVKAGMGAILVSSPNIAHRVFGMLHSYQKQFDGVGFLQGESSEMLICGMTGRAGAGKTTLAKKVVESGANAGFDTEYLSLDVFFKMSSCQRKAWLNEVKGVDDEEYARRTDQMCWWDFDRCEEAIGDLRAGRTVHLAGVYNRADGGELTGVVHIEPRARLRLVMEGVAIAHMAYLFDDLGMLHAPAGMRKDRLGTRDKHRKGSEIDERFRITEQFEDGYFANNARFATTHIDNTNGIPVVIGDVPGYMD